MNNRKNGRDGFNEKRRGGKMKFFLVKLAAVALIAGLAGLILLTLAKILVGALIIGGIVMAFKNGSRRRQGFLPSTGYDQLTAQPVGFNSGNFKGFSNSGKNFSEAAIIPIN